MCRSFSRVYRFYRDIDKDLHSQHVFTDVDSKTVQSILDDAVSNNHLYLPENEAEKILRNIWIPNSSRCTFKITGGSTAAIAQNIGFPVVLKIVSPDIIHKSDVNGVVLNVNSAEEVMRSYEEITSNILKIKPEAIIEGIQSSRK